MKHKKIVFGLCVTVVICLLLIVPYIVRSVLWEKDKHNLIASVENSFSTYDNIKINYVDIQENTGKFIFNDNFWKPYETDIKVEIECFNDIDTEEKLKYILIIRNICNEFLQNDKHNLFSRSGSINLTIKCDTKDKLMSYPHCLEVCLGNRYHSMFSQSLSRSLSEDENPKNDNDITNCLDKMYTFEELCMKELRLFKDFKQISAPIYDLKDNSDFSEFTKLKYLYILNLDYQNDENLVNDISSQLSPYSKVYINNGSRVTVVKNNALQRKNHIYRI